MSFAKKNIDNMLVQLGINVEHLNFIPHSTLYYIFCLIFDSNKLATYFVWSLTKTINFYGLFYIKSDMIPPPPQKSNGL